MSPVQHNPAGVITSTTTATAATAGHAAGPVLTVRAVAAGLMVGAVLCFSNTYFGLQTGWVTMGSLQVRYAAKISNSGSFQTAAAAATAAARQPQNSIKSLGRLTAQCPG
jgi:hypothetical protein